MGTDSSAAFGRQKPSTGGPCPCRKATPRGRESHATTHLPAPRPQPHVDPLHSSLLPPARRSPTRRAAACRSRRRYDARLRARPTRRRHRRDGAQVHAAGRASRAPPDGDHVPRALRRDRALRAPHGQQRAVYKILGKNGLSPTAWTINAAAIHNDEVSQPHADFDFQVQELLCTDADPVMAGPATSCCSRSPPSPPSAGCAGARPPPPPPAGLRAQPAAARAAAAQQEEHEKEGEIDLLLTTRRPTPRTPTPTCSWRAAAELQAGTFSTYNPKVTDEQNARAYGLTAAQIPANFRSEATTYIAFKINLLEARRASTAVAEGWRSRTSTRSTASSAS